MSKALQKFKLGGDDGIFNIYTGRDIIIRDTKSGDIPLVSHQHENNGITKYIDKISNRIVFNHKSTIALADRGVFLATVQYKDFHIGTRVKALEFKDGEKSTNIKIYIATAINKLQQQFTEYSSNATNKLPDLTVMLPCTSGGAIDYKFMEDYISQLKKDELSDLDSYLCDNALDNCDLTEEEQASVECFRNKNIFF